MITKLKLVNWKSHANTELEFLKGTNVLVGVMGAGKTAVLDAISFALFGMFPALQSKKIAIDDCITNKPEPKSKAVIELVFTKDKNEYTVTREITRGKGTTRSELRKNNELVEAPQTKRVTEEITRVLGMDYDLFSRAVYSEQNQVDYFLQIPAGQRKKKIDELLKINKFEKARKTAALVVRQLKNEASSIEEQLRIREEPDTEKEEKVLEELVKTQQELIKKEEEAREKLIVQEKTLNELEQRQKQRQELQNKINSLKSKIEVYSLTQSEVKERLSKAGDYKQALQKNRELIKELTQRINELEKAREQEKIIELEKQVTLLENQQKQLTEKLAQKQSLKKIVLKLEQKNVEKALSELTKKKEELIKEKSELELVVKEATKQITTLETVEDKCPVCEGPITPQKREELVREAGTRISHAKTRLSRINEELEEINLDKLRKELTELEKARKELLELKNVEQEIEANKTQLAQAKKELEEKMRYAEEQEKKLSELRKEKEELLEKTRELEQLEEDEKKLEEINKQVKELMEKLKNATTELEKISFDEQELLKARQEKLMLSSQLTEITTKAKATQELITQQKKLIDELNQRKKELTAMKQRKEKLEQASEAMELFKKAIENTQVQLREHFITGVNDALTMVWRKIYPYGDYPQLRLGVEKGDYALQVQTLGNKWVNIEGFVSGGERSTAALALRIAFSMVLAPQLSWLVLDEPTHNLDSNGVSKLAKTMRDELPQLVEQIFIITHDDEMEAAVSGNLYRLERDKSKDEPTKAVLVASGKD